MELDKSLFFKIKDMNCEFRTLHDSDVSKEYVDGLKQQTKYIMNIPKNVSISSQKKYVKDVLCSKDDTICGLFINNKLVGTAGVQSSRSFLLSNKVTTEYVATIGIFLFNKIEKASSKKNIETLLKNKVELKISTITLNKIKG